MSGSLVQRKDIEAYNIGKSFGLFTALDEVSMKIPQGEFLTLLGPSGSGKTTFLMILAGFELASRGHILFAGEEITNRPPEKRGFGMVFQGYALFPHMSVQENIAFPLKVQRRSPRQIRERVAQMIELMGLKGHETKRATALSGGQQQRVALGRALAYEPPVLLLDEPFSALDKSLREQMQDEMRRIHRELGTTFVFVTHDQSEAMALAQRIAVFNQGRLQQIGTPSEVYEHPSSRFVAEFLGDINIFDVQADKGVADLEGHRLILSGSQGSGNQHSGRAQLAVRPEYLTISRSPDPGRNSLPCTLIDRQYRGSQTRLSLRSHGGAGFIVDLPTPQLTADLSPDDPLWAIWSAENSRLL